MTKEAEITRRTEIALTAIREGYKKGGGIKTGGVTEFVDHHIEEIEKSYWLKQLGKSNPQPKDVLDLLVLRGHWSESDFEDPDYDGENGGLDIFDFTLKDDATNYVVSVQFDDAGEIEWIIMES